MPSDIEIAQAAKMQRISAVAREKLGIAEEHLEPFGHYKAKVSLDYLATLKNILHDTDEVGMGVELTLFSHETWLARIRLENDAADRAVANLTRELLPYRHVSFQIWNEFSQRVLDHVKTVRSVDPKRIVTNSPGVAGFLGDPPQNTALDYLTPHTSRQGSGRTWEIAPTEIEYLPVSMFFLSAANLSLHALTLLNWFVSSCRASWSETDEAATVARCKASLPRS